MRNLLHANFSRLFHSGAFRAALAAEFAYALFIIGVTFYSIYIKEGGQFGLEEPLLFAFGIAGMIPVPMLIQAPFLSVYLGTEFSEGTIRNKLVTGRSKAAVYLSNLLACMTASVLLAVLYLALVGIAAAPTGLPLKMPAGQLLLLACYGLLALAACTALVTMAAMLIRNETKTVIVTLSAALFAMFLIGFLTARLGEPEFTAVYDEWGRDAAGMLPNPNYLQPVPRAVCRFLIDLLPTGQCLQISARSVEQFWRMPLLSLSVIAASTAAGLLLFRRKDLK